MKKTALLLLALLLAASWMLPALAEDNQITLTMPYDDAYQHALTLLEGDNDQEGVALLTTLAENGHAASSLHLGKLYANGLHVDEDVEKAIVLYRQAQAGGERGAAFVLGYAYASRLKDYETAVPYYQEAVSYGDAGAMNNLALLYRDGKGVERDLTKAVELLEQAAESGSVRAMNNLGSGYANATLTDGEKDYALAAQWYQKAADNQHAEAMVSLARLYISGDGVEADGAKAEALLLEAEKLGSTNACAQLGYGYANAKFNTEGVKDYALAAQYYEKAAEQGNTAAMNNLALLYLNGQGVEADPVRAEELMKQAAARENVTAMENLGRNYRSGAFNGGTPDYPQAAQWFLKAAEAGSCYGAEQAAALYLYERRAEDGTVLMAIDYQAGFAAVQLAEKLGTDDSYCLFWLGYFHEGFQAYLPADMSRAVAFYERAAEQQQTVSMRRLAVLYRDGKLGEPDPVTAMAWLDKAIALEDNDARVMAALLYTTDHLAKDGTVLLAADHARAFALLEAAGEAVNDDALALDWLGFYYAGNRSVVAEPDYEKAVACYTRAAELDNAYAMHQLGCIYRDGRLGEPDPRTALSWYRRAAELGDQRAALEAALAALNHYSATGELAQHHAMIFSLLQQAGEEVNSSRIALDWLGFYYAGNHGVVDAPDYEQAAAIYQRSAALGSGYAMAQLGLLYRDGHGFEQDYAQARLWLSKALEQGYETAQDLLNNLNELDKQKP